MRNVMNWKSPSAIAITSVLFACGGSNEPPSAPPIAIESPRLTLTDVDGTVLAAPSAAPPQSADPMRAEFTLPAGTHGLDGVPDVLRHHASKVIGCPVEKISVQQVRTGPNPSFATFLADGCGKRLAYGLCDFPHGGAECYTITSLFSIPSGAVP